MWFLLLRVQGRVVVPRYVRVPATGGRSVGTLYLPTSTRADGMITVQTRGW